MNDLRVKCVRKLGRKIGQLLLEQNLLLLSGAECFYLLWVKGLEVVPQSCKSEGVLADGTFLSILDTRCDLPCYRKSDAETRAVLLQSPLQQGRSLKTWKATGLLLYCWEHLGCFSDNSQAAPRTPGPSFLPLGCPSS